MSSARPIATLSADGQSVTIRKGDWVQTFGADRLAFWIRFYRDLTVIPAAKGKPAVPHPHAHCYAATLAALERVARLRDVMTAGQGRAA